jgi:hypothetical protein
MGERVVAGCIRQQRLIDALLELARRPWLARREPVDLAAIASAALRAHDAGGLATLVALESAWTTGDPDLLERLAANIVSNAIRHNVAGGWIAVTTRARSGRAVLGVANAGLPVAAGELRRSDGAGVGLAVVQAIADAHDAVVAAHARPGGGLRIEVGFPAAGSGGGEGGHEALDEGDDLLDARRSGVLGVALAGVPERDDPRAEPARVVGLAPDADDDDAGRVAGRPTADCSSEARHRTRERRTSSRSRGEGLSPSLLSSSRSNSR